MARRGVVVCVRERDAPLLASTLSLHPRAQLVDGDFRGELAFHLDRGVRARGHHVHRPADATAIGGGREKLRRLPKDGTTSDGGRFYS